jgi:membrane-associated HD superfamily phosphohydrolase
MHIIVATEIFEVTVIAMRGLVLSLLVGLTHVPALQAKAQEPSQAQIQLPHTPQEDKVEDEARRKFERDQQKKANEERFQKLKEDTEKLVQLSNELKEYVGKANEHTLSLDVIKKAEEIERLAKSVKDKMRAN